MGDLVQFEKGKLHLRCVSCKKLNAVPLDKLNNGPLCGSCKADLLAPAKPVELNDTNFDDFIKNAPVPVLVDFWAPWCGPCQAMGPAVQSLARSKSGRALVAKLNTEQSPRVAAGFRIQSIPTTMVFDKGRVFNSRVGLMREQELASLLP